MRNLILVFLLFFVGCSKTGGFKYEPVDWNSTAPTLPQTLPQPSKDKEVPDFIKNLLAYHNEQRELKGRTKFDLDSYLIDYAQNHAGWMSKKNWMKHSDVSVLIGRYSAVGENIAYNQKDEKTVVVAWMNSTGHRQNILNRNFTKIGFGVSNNARGEPYWCTVFGN
jgi:uncharacterized protein YkwD